VKVLGIDPGTRTTGYGIVRLGRGGRLERICDGEIAPDPKIPLSERLFVISKTLTGIMLGHARGVAFLSAAAFGIPVFEYSPTKIKQAVVGYGGATKEQVQKMVKFLLKTAEDSSPDAADALAAAICHIHHSGGVSNARRRALASPG
jgi:crossover junction endodeoxyribonuclease RuvC